MSALSTQFQNVGVKRLRSRVWEYAPWLDARAMQASRNLGSVVTVQRRQPDGSFVLLAKIAARNRP